MTAPVSAHPPWSAEIRRRGFRIELVITAGLLVAALAGLASFLQVIEQRAGVVLDDPVLATGGPVDLTWLTFALIYGSIVAAAVTLSRRPRLLLTAVQSYVVMVMFRMAVMWVTPFDPPSSMLPLVDPFVEFFGTGNTLTRDLFFSGHTSTLLLLGLASERRGWRVFFFLCTAGVAAAVLLQHVHYTVDVLCAPFFAYGAYRIVMAVQAGTGVLASPELPVAGREGDSPPAFAARGRKTGGLNRAHPQEPGVHGGLDRSQATDGSGVGRPDAGTDRPPGERLPLELDLSASRQQLRDLSAHLQSAREEERKSFARDVHDDLGQALTTLKLELSLLAAELRPDDTGPRERIAAMSRLVEATIRSVKRIIAELRPRLLDDLGLTAAVEWQAEEFQKNTGIPVTLSVYPAEILLDPDRSTALFRIFQETLSNVSRHARASHVTASLTEIDGMVELTVEDNGCGITEAQIADPHAFGLIGIRERAAHLEGTAEITGTPGEGTRVRVRFSAIEGES